MNHGRTFSLRGDICERINESWPGSAQVAYVCLQLKFAEWVSKRNGFKCFFEFHYRRVGLLRRVAMVVRR